MKTVFLRLGSLSIVISTKLDINKSNFQWKWSNIKVKVLKLTFKSWEKNENKVKVKQGNEKWKQKCCKDKVKSEVTVK